MRVQFRAGTDRVTAAYPSLPPRLKKCAAYILEHPSEVATLSMRQLAARAEVPPSTMARLARALDLPGFEAFRSLYRDSINRPAAADGIHAVTAASPLDQALDAYQQAAVSNINTLFDHVDRAALERAVEALLAARSVVVVGMHASYALSYYLHALATAGMANWRLATRHSGGLADLLESLRRDDVVVGIAVEPGAADTIRFARQARALGARVVGITDRRTSPLAGCADEVLLYPVQTPAVFPSHVGAAVLVEVLAGLAIVRSGRAALERMDRLQGYRQALGEYWTD